MFLQAEKNVVRLATYKAPFEDTAQTAQTDLNLRCTHNANVKRILVRVICNAGV